MARGLLVSIIIPTYNRPTFIEKTIDSVYKQNYKNFEVIVMDDFSTLTYKLKKRKRLKYFKSKIHVGPAALRNKGVEMAHGKIVFILDDDIILKKNTLTLLVNDLIKYKKDKVAAVACRLLYPQKKNYGIVKNKSLVEISKFTGDIILRSSLDTKKPVFTETLHACAAIWKGIFKKIRFDDKRYKGNYTYVEPDFYLRLRKLGFKLLFEPKAIAHHYQIKEGGCRNMSKFTYNYYTIRNFFMFSLRFYKFRTICYFPFYILNKIFHKTIKNEQKNG